MKKIVWVDDHEILCIALSEYVKQHAIELSDDAVEAIPIFSLDSAMAEVNKDCPPDLVFLDLNLDKNNCGIATLERFQVENKQNVPVVVCTGLDVSDDGNVDLLRRCMRDHAAKGILLKGGAHKKMFVGLGRLLEGEIWIPEDLVMRFAGISDQIPDTRQRHHLGLTPREWDIAIRIGRGLRGKEIARELHIAPGHVRQVSCLIYGKLQVRNRTEAALRVNAELTGTNGQQGIKHPPTLAKQDDRDGPSRKI
jgi:two-component system, NarL family, nitrate/nitrite response regulator NarL